MKHAFIVICIIIAFIFSGAVALAEPFYANYQQMLINKDHKLPENFEPDNTFSLNKYMSARSSVTLHPDASKAIEEMIAAMEKDGITDIYGQSGFRSFDVQQTLNKRKVNYMHYLGYSWTQAETLACQVVAIAGSSEHQSGLAIDFTTSRYSGRLLEDFALTPAGKWLADNSWKYGFILRYPKEKMEITGYIYEPWHFRYVGVQMAEYIHKNDLCLEELFITLEDDRFVLSESEDGNDYIIVLCKNYANFSKFGEMISLSRAYADSMSYYIIIAKVPNYQVFGAINILGENSVSVISGDIADENLMERKQLNYRFPFKLYEI